VVAIELILTLFLGFFLLMWLGIRVRKTGRWFREKGLMGVSLVLIVVGVILFLIAYLSTRLSWLSVFEPWTPLYMKVGTALLIAGAAGIILDQLYRTWKKEKLLGIEEERREFISRTRFGLPVEQAEKIAKEHIKKVVGKKTKLVASKKEFKHWAVYLKDSEQKYYRIVINGDSKIEEWETMDEIPSYILSP
jgi:hypothetical protein